MPKAIHERVERAEAGIGECHFVVKVNYGKGFSSSSFGLSNLELETSRPSGS